MALNSGGIYDLDIDWGSKANQGLVRSSVKYEEEERRKRELLLQIRSEALNVDDETVNKFKSEGYDNDFINEMKKASEEGMKAKAEEENRKKQEELANRPLYQKAGDFLDRMGGEILGGITRPVHTLSGEVGQTTESYNRVMAMSDEQAAAAGIDKEAVRKKWKDTHKTAQDIQKEASWAHEGSEMTRPFVDDKDKALSMVKTAAFVGSGAATKGLSLGKDLAVNAAIDAPLGFLNPYLSGRQEYEGLEGGDKFKAGLAEGAQETVFGSLFNLGIRGAGKGGKYLADTVTTRAVDNINPSVKTSVLNQMDDMAMSKLAKLDGIPSKNGTVDFDIMKSELNDVSDYMVAKGGKPLDIGKMDDMTVAEMYINSKTNPIASPDEIANFKSQAMEADISSKAARSIAVDDYKFALDAKADAQASLRQAEKAMTSGKSNLSLKEMSKIIKQYKTDIANFDKKLSKITKAFPDIDTDSIKAVAPEETINIQKPAQVEDPNLPSKDIRADVPVKEVPDNVEIINEPEVKYDPKAEKAIEAEIEDAIATGDQVRAAQLSKQYGQIETKAKDMYGFMESYGSKEEIDLEIGKKEPEFVNAVMKLKKDKGNKAVMELLDKAKRAYDNKPGETLYGNPVDRIKEAVTGLPQDTEAPLFAKRYNDIQFEELIDDAELEAMIGKAPVTDYADAQAQVVMDEILKPMFGDNYNLEVGAKFEKYMRRNYSPDYVKRHFGDFSDTAPAVTLKDTIGIIDTNRSKFDITTDGLHESLHLYHNLLSTDGERALFAKTVRDQYGYTPEFREYTRMRQELQVGKPLNDVQLSEEFAAQKFTEYYLKKEGYRGFKMDWKTGKVEKLADFKKVDSPYKGTFVGKALDIADTVYLRLKALVSNSGKIEQQFKDIYSGKAAKAVDTNYTFQIPENADGSLWYSLKGMDANQMKMELDKYLALQDSFSRKGVNRGRVDDVVDEIESSLVARGVIDADYVNMRGKEIVATGRTDAFLKDFLDADVRADGSYKILNRNLDVQRAKSVSNQMRSSKNPGEALRFAEELKARGFSEDEVLRIAMNREGEMIDGVRFNQVDNVPDWYRRATGDVPTDIPSTATKELAPGGNVKEAMDNFDLLTKFRQVVEDSNVRVKQKMRERGVRVSDANDIYMNKENMVSMVGQKSAEVEQELRLWIKDLHDTAKMNKLEIKELRGDVQEYLLSTTGLERNRVKGADVVYGKGLEETQAKFANKIKEIQAKPHGAEVKRLADAMQKNSKDVLDIYLESGMITRQAYDKLSTDYQYHTALNRDFSADGNGLPIEDAVIAPEGMIGGTGNPSVSGPAIKKVGEGFDYQVGDIVENQTLAKLRAINLAEKNKAAKSVIQFANDNPDMGIEIITNPETGAPINQVIKDNNVITAFIDGQPVNARIADPDLAEAIKGMNTEQIGPLLKASKAINSLRSFLVTTANPAFAPANKVRDVQEILNYIYTLDEFKGTKSKATKRMVSDSMKAVYDFKRGKSTADTKLYQQFLDDGGAIGGMSHKLGKRGDALKLIEKEFKVAGSNPRKAARATGQFLEDYNDVFENSSRFAIYKTAVENGVSRQRASWLAKEAGINFQRFGSGGKAINALYMFANASIQGTSRTARAWINDPKQFFKTAGIIGSATMAMNAWNDSVDENWRDDTRLSAFTRASNMIIVTPFEVGGKKQIIKIPVGWSLKPLKALSDGMYDVGTGWGTPTDALESVAQSIAEGYNPTGGSESLFMSGVPSAIKPGVEILSNQDFMGSPIRPRGKDNLPASMQYYDSTLESPTGRAAVKASKFLSDVTGGKKTGVKGIIEISPEDLIYGLEQYTGSLARTGRDIAKTFTEGANPANLPIINRFLGDLRPSRQAEMEMYEILGRRTPEDIKQARIKQELKEKYGKDDTVSGSDIDRMKAADMTDRQINNFIEDLKETRMGKSFKSLNAEDEERIYQEMLNQYSEEELEEMGIEL